MLQKDNRYKILKIFFEDPLTEGIGFHLREISRRSAIAPPSVKEYLKELEKSGLIIKVKHRLHKYPVYYANRDNEYFKFLKKLDTMMMIRECGLLDYLYNKSMADAIVLFGSASIGEDLKDSDLDIFLLSGPVKLELEKYEKKLSRKINPFFSKSLNKLSKELKNNIINGIILKGYLKVF